MMYNCLMRLKILLLGDDPFQVALLEEIVKEFGHNVFTASKSHTALEMAGEHFAKLSPFDVIFINWPIPDVDVDALTRELKDVDPENVIIALTEDYSVETRLELVKYSGFNGYINKASDVKDVKRYLDMAMSAKKKKLSGEKSIYREKREKSTNK